MRDAEHDLLAEVEERHWWHRVLRRAIRDTLAAHAPPRPLRVLDAGCGAGGVVRDLTRAGHDVVGFDLAARALAHARRLGTRQVLRASVDELPFADEAFDAVISIDVISQRSASELPALRETQRVLRPGGLLVLQLSAFKALAGEHDRTHRQDRYERPELLGLLGDSGLELVDLRYRLAFLPPLMVLNNALSRLRPSRGPDLQVPAAPINAALRLAGALDWRLGARAPAGSSLWCVARRP